MTTAETEPDRRLRAAALLAALLLTAAALHGALGAGFVWDDDAQVVENELLRQGHLGEALTSDVWGFKRDDAGVGSDYWRPLFVSWLVANFRLFDVSPLGWHLTTLLLHVAVLLLAAGVLRRLRFDPVTSAATLWLFAAHPARVESAAWISGSTDVMLAAFLLGALACHVSGGVAPTRGRRVAAWGLFLAALLTKEAAILFPLLPLAIEWARPDGVRGRLWFRPALVATLPYMAVVVAYLLLRWAVLGRFVFPAEGGPGPATVLLSVPRLAAFYLHHAFWPVGLSPVYAIDPVTPADVGWATLAIPLALLLGFVAVALWLVRRDRANAIGVALFIVPLLPVLNVALLSPGRLVHDRYLYLPVLGAALLAVALARTFIGRRVVLAAAGAAALACVWLSVDYVRAWRDDVALWKRAVAVQPRSNFARANLGFHYREAGRLTEARRALEEVLDGEPEHTRALVDLGLVALDEGRPDEAERLFRRAWSIDPQHLAALEQLGLALLAQERLPEAVGVFDETRRRHPQLRVRSTLNLAMLLVRLERAELALAELESIVPDLERETDATLLVGYLRLGRLYAARGRTAEAVTALRTYIARTVDARDPAIDGLRREAVRQLNEIEGTAQE